MISRWEVTFNQRKRDLSWGFLNRDLFPTFQGLAVLPFLLPFHWRTRLLFMIEGDDDSLAKNMTDFIESSASHYPCLNEYQLAGPNSNSYAQWIIDKFPEAKMCLPWNAIGKNYRF